MTTIVADARVGVMVCDSRTTVGETWHPSTKVWRWGSELVGCAGTDDNIQRWRKWYEGGKRGARPKCENFCALILRDSGVWYAYDGGHECLIERGFHGIGTGGPSAIAVMLAGHDAKMAVEIACQVDVASGGEVILHRLKPEPKATP